MFQGHAICTLDAKSRLVLPSKFRKYIKTESNNKLILMKGMDQCIMAFPSDEWEKKVKEAAKKFNIFNPVQRNFLRQLLNDIYECEIDAHNRILLPSELASYAEIKKEVIVLGMIYVLEIWDPVAKKKYDELHMDTYEDAAQKVSEMFFNFGDSEQ